MFSDFIEVPGEWVTQLKLTLERDPPILGAVTLGGQTVAAAPPPGIVTPDTDWVPVTSFLNGWANYGGGFPPARFRKLASGLIVLSGLLKNGASGTMAFTLPAGYRPAEYRHLVAAAMDDVMVVRIDTGGNVQLNFTAGGWHSLDGVNFYP